MRTSQVKKLRDHLEKGNRITSWGTAELVKTSTPSKVISDLRKMLRLEDIELEQDWNYVIEDGQKIYRYEYYLTNK